MDVVVVFKWSRNPEDALVRPDGSVDWRGAKMVASADDAAAVEYAVALSKSTGGQVTGVTIGDGDPTWVLARGAAQVDSIEGVPALDDDAATAAALAAGVGQAGPFDLVVMGDSSQEHPGVAACVAGLLELPALLGVDDVAGDPSDPGRVVVHRSAAGSTETLTAATPALISVAAVAAEKKAPGMKEMLAARRRPVTKIAAADAAAPVTDAVSVEGTQVPEHQGARLFDGEPAEAARTLVAALQVDGAL